MTPAQKTGPALCRGNPSGIFTINLTTISTINIFFELGLPTYRLIKKEGVKNIYLYLQNYLIHKKISYIPESLRTGHLCWCVFLAYYYIFASFLKQVSCSDYFPKPSYFKVHKLLLTFSAWFLLGISSKFSPSPNEEERERVKDVGEDDHDQTD